MENQDNQLNWSWNNDQPNQTESTQPEWNQGNNQENINQPTWENGNNTPQTTEFQEPEVQWGSNTPESINEDIPLDQPQQQLNEFYYLGKVNSNIHNKSLWNIPINLELIQDELNKIELTPKGTEGLFDFSPSSNTELGKLIKNIFEIGLTKNLKIKDCFVIKSNQNINNIFENQKNKFNFIFPISNDNRSLLELSIPHTNEIALASHLSPSVLTILPGWTSYNLNISQNLNDTILICGTYEQH